jgi:glycosyltransferase involved in cell wall biosynthesis
MTRPPADVPPAGPRPRILVLSAYYYPFQGGTETHARTVTTSLHRQGFQVVVVTKRDERRSPRFERIDEVPVHRIPPAGPRSGFRKWAMIPVAIAKLIELRREFDLIYCPGYQGIGIAAIAAGGLLRRPVVLRSGNLGVLVGNQWDAPLRRWHIPPGSRPVRWLKQRFTNLYERADALACNCRENEEEALGCGMPRERVHYLPNAVDVERFRPARAGERARLRAELGWPQESFLWLYVGRLSREKGVLDLLAAWRQVVQGGVLVLVGPDMHGHPLDAGPAARQYVADHGLERRVIFHGESTDAAPLLRAADAYVQPSHYESFSNALVEAMATGLPLVASRVGGMLDCVVEGDNGLLCRPGDAADLGLKMQEILADPGRASRFGARARETVVADFNEATMLRRFADLLVATWASRRTSVRGKAGER